MRMAILFLIVFGFFRRDNEPPVVKITEPKNYSSFKTGTVIPFAIHVTDKEDGDSRFDEINSAEVLMEARTIRDSTQLPTLPNREGLQAMMASNCMNCHAFDAKLIGPSFKAIGERYHQNSSNIPDLVKHVREGSRGIWGDVIMPTHPELSVEETTKMVEWILGFYQDKNVNYYTGTEGSIRVPVQASIENSILVLTASYRDHGSATGEDRVIVNLKQ